MICWYNLKSDLLKAVQLKKDHSGMVLVERIETHSKTGTVYRHTHWVRPSEVKPTDRVLRGQHNLQSGHKDKLHPASAAKLSQRSKDVTDAFFSKFNSMNDFFDALDKMDIPWKKNPNPGINLMWAKMSLRAAVENGFDPDTAWSKIQSTLAAAPQPTQPAPTQPAPAQPTVTLNQIKVGSTKYSQAVKDKTKAFANSFATIQDFYDALAKFGINVVQYPNPGITLMRAKMALNDKIAAGFDPFNPTGANITPTQPTVSDAKDTNKNNPQPQKDPDAIEAPKDATPQQLERLKYINQLTDPEEIIKLALTGIVPKDEYAKEYLIEKGFESMNLWVGTYVDTRGRKISSKEVGKKWIADLNKFGFPPLIKSDVSDKFSGGIPIAALSIQGFKKSDIADAVRFNMYDFSPKVLIDPQDVVLPYYYYTNAYTPERIIKTLNSTFSDYATDEYDGHYFSNMGYSDNDPDEYRKRYDPEKEGFVRALRKIESDNAGNVEVKERVDQMIKDYDEVMTICGGNPNLLEKIITTRSYNSDQLFQTSLNSFEQPDFGEESAMKTTSLYHFATDQFLDILHDEGYTDSEIIDSIYDNYDWGSSDLSNYKIKDANGQVKTIDIHSKFSVTPDDKKAGSSFFSLVQNEIQKNNGWDDDTAKANGLYRTWNLSTENRDNTVVLLRSYDQISGISESDFKRVHEKLANLVGYDCDFSKWDSTTGSGLQFPPQKLTTGGKAVLSNLIMMKSICDVNNDIARHITDYTSNAVDKNDYSKSFDWYSGDASQRVAGGRVKQVGSHYTAVKIGTVPTYTIPELQAQITKQLNGMPNFSPDYLEKISSYYDNKSAANPLDQSSSEKTFRLKADWNKILDSPMKDVHMGVFKQVFNYMPKMRDNPKYPQNIEDKLDYIPFDFTKDRQPRPSENKKAKPKATPTDISLKQARQTLFDRSTCSFRAFSKEDSIKMWKENILNRFDYVPGEVSLLTKKTMTKKVHSGAYAPNGDQRALMNSRFFAIEDTDGFEQNFNERVEKIKANPNCDDSCSEILDIVHGTGRANFVGAVGRDHAFYMAGQNNTSGAMMGDGFYGAGKVGKSSTYVGLGDENPHAHNCQAKYCNRSADISGERSTGPILFAKAVKGEHYIQDGIDYGDRSKPVTSTFRSPGSGGWLNDEEGVFGDNALILPTMIVDTTMGMFSNTKTPHYKKSNLRRDADGNYVDKDGNITHDKYGISVNLK